MALTSEGRTGASRVQGLDGLRGLAALLVVVHHTLLLTPVFVLPYFAPRNSDLPPIVALFTYTPLHVLWDGPVAVFVFFALSGFVLTLQFRNVPRNWVAYYPARLIRLYVPVWAAVAIALMVATIPHLQRGDSWVRGHRGPSMAGVTKDLLLIVGMPGATNSVLWSLRWEVAFSILLPSFVAFALIWRRASGAKVVVLLALCILGARFGASDFAPNLPALFQLPIFGLGCILAVEWERIRDRSQKLGGSRGRLAIVSVVWS